MDLDATPKLSPQTGATCAVDTDCASPLLACSASTKTCTDKSCSVDTDCPKHFTCVTDVDPKKTKKCMISVATNDFINSGGETKPMAGGTLLGQFYNALADDLAAYITSLGTITPGTHNFTAPSTSDPKTRIIELP